MMVNRLDDSNFHRQTAVMTRLIEMIIQNPVFGISCMISYHINQKTPLSCEQLHHISFPGVDSVVEINNVTHLYDIYV
jgi:hypothetical protein